MDGYLTKKY